MKQYNIMGGIDEINNNVEVKKGVLDGLINDNYDSIVKRGLITPNTTKQDFIDKICEEVNEFWSEVIERNDSGIKEELADIILTCLNFAKHYNIDIETELKKKIKVNFNR